MFQKVANTGVLAFFGFGEAYCFIGQLPDDDEPTGYRQGTIDGLSELDFSRHFATRSEKFKSMFW
jgi:hypothetical protein